MTNALEAISMVLVGALWGCTNPVLRQGAVQAANASDGDSVDGEASFQTLVRQLLHVRVWLPCVMNQLGSVLFYITLVNANISLAVPICNGLALVFSVVTSLCVLGEPLQRPVLTITGATLVVMGVTICLQTSSENSDSGNGDTDTAAATMTRLEL